MLAIDEKQALTMAQSIQCGQNWLFGPYHGPGAEEAGAGAGVLIADNRWYLSHTCLLLRVDCNPCLHPAGKGVTRDGQGRKERRQRGSSAGFSVENVVTVSQKAWPACTQHQDVGDALKIPQGSVRNQLPPALQMMSAECVIFCFAGVC